MYLLIFIEVGAQKSKVPGAHGSLNMVLPQWPNPSHSMHTGFYKLQRTTVGF